jgi:hypothetical protein
MKIAITLTLAVASLHAQNLTTATQRYFNSVRKNLESSADAMPADKYNYRLTDGQMSFGEWLIHSAQRNYADCALLKSETAPTVADLKTKDEIAKALKDSFAYCAPIIEHPDEPKILASPQMSYAFLHIIVHNNEIYGNIVGYLRSSSIVPPSTAGRGAQTKK